MKRRAILIVIIILILGGAAYGANIWYQNSHYVTTDNARISAPMISVTTLATGQVISMNVEIGDRVEQGQSIAEVGTPRFSDSTTRQGYQATPLGRTAIESPVSGYVAAVWTYPGAIISAGTPLVTIADCSNMWVSANIDETQIGRVSPGQVVEVHIDSLGGMLLKGKVEGISPATAANFSLLPQSNSSANFIKVVQVIPVKITLDKTDGIFLIPGSSVAVKILTR